MVRVENIKILKIRWRRWRASARIHIDGEEYSVWVVHTSFDKAQAALEVQVRLLQAGMRLS